MEKIVILGQGGHAASLVDTIERENKYCIAGYIVNDAEKGMGGYPVLGRDSDLENIFHSGITCAAVGIGYMGRSDLREKLWQRLRGIGFSLPVICDPSATVAESAFVGEGSFIGKNAVVNAGASVGAMCIVNTGAIVEHDCTIDDCSHIAIGAVLCGNVKVGRAVFVGANATVIQRIRVGDGCIVGAGEVLRKDMGNHCMFKENVLRKMSGGGHKPFHLAMSGGLAA